MTQDNENKLSPALIPEQPAIFVQLTPREVFSALSEAIIKKAQDQINNARIHVDINIHIPHNNKGELLLANINVQGRITKLNQKPI